MLNLNFNFILWGVSWAVAYGEALILIIIIKKIKKKKNDGGNEA